MKTLMRLLRAGAFAGIRDRRVPALPADEGEGIIARDADDT